MMDAGNIRPQLPALTYLDVSKVKREEEAYQNRITGAPQTLPALPTASPTHQYPLGPPPPYSQPSPHNANFWSSTIMPQGIRTSPEPRRTSVEEYENTKQNTRQSLPSLSEALGVDSQTSYASAPVPPPLLSATKSHTIRPSPPPDERKALGLEPPQAPYTDGTGSQRQSYSNLRPDASSQNALPAQTSSRSAHVSTSDRPSLHLQTSQPSSRQHQASYPPYPSNASPVYEQPAAQSTNSMGPPKLPYGYTPYPPRYAQPTASSDSVGPIYQPSTAYAAPMTPSSSWKPESAPSKFRLDERPAAPADYSTSVKRHLELYDLEGSLNEIAQTSGIMMDFSRRYGDRLHQNARSRTTIQSLPGMVEVDDMIHKSRIQLDALMKIRDVVVTQEAAYEQQAADQRQRHKSFADSAPSSLDLQDADEAKAGFAGADTKKRRGRAAPPGRCHSCNRAETPEWRRGPDGARTLCNACGLHYAKLTRKQQTASKTTAAPGSSNLRPKEA